MTSDADLAFAAGRLRRRLVLWRAAFLIAVVGAVAAGSHGQGGTFLHRPAVDVLTVDGLITDEPRRIAALDAARRDPLVRALILRIDSPGGSVSGGEDLHDAVARFALHKPVVVVMGGEAASAGYMIAVPARRIFASNATLTGSIGVLLESPDVSGLLGKLGVAVDMLVSGPLKGQPSVTGPLSPQGRAMLQGIVGDLYDQFVAMVATGRHMDPARVRALADGRPYTGHQALPLGLIDQIGDEEDARDWLAASAGVPRSLPLDEIDWRTPRRKFAMFTGSMIADLLPQASLLGQSASRAVLLDGAEAIWQPPAVR